MEKLEIYNRVRNVPQEAQKTIGGGRLKGFTDINPMWRIKVLTEQFGVCGDGWKYEIVSQDLKNGANGEIAAFVTINLYVKINGEWTYAIPGIGGSMFVSNEKNGAYTSDECFKMAFTDALGVACKALGFAADIYFAKDKTKYDAKPDTVSQQVNAPKRLSKSQMDAIPTSNELDNLKAAGTIYALDDNQKTIINKRIKELEDQLYAQEEEKRLNS
jgi:hypothetical protein